MFPFPFRSLFLQISKLPEAHFQIEKLLVRRNTTVHDPKSASSAPDCPISAQPDTVSRLLEQYASNLQSLLALRPAAADAPGLRALKVSSGDPALVESTTSLCAAGDSRAIGTNDGNLLSGVDFLALAGGTRSALAALAAAALLGEESGDPGVVDEVDDATEGGEEEEVEEDAGRGILLVCDSFLYGNGNSYI